MQGRLSRTQEDSLDGRGEIYLSMYEAPPKRIKLFPFSRHAGRHGGDCGGVFKR